MGLKGFRERAKEMKDDLLDQHVHQREHADDKGTTRGSIMLLDKIPEGMEEFKPGIGDHIVDVIPFYAGTQHPMRAEGRLAYVVDLWAHKNIGALKAWLVCQAKTWEKPDLLCDYINANRLSKKDWGKVRAFRRTVYLIWDHTNPEEEEKGVQWWDVSHFFFEEKVAKLGKDRRTGEQIPWSHHDFGKSVAFTIEKDSYTDDEGSKQDSHKYSGHELLDRLEQKIPEHILAQSFPLDEAINMHPPEEDWTNAAPFAAGGSKSEPAETGKFGRSNLKPKTETPSTGCVMGHKVLGEGYNKYEECNTCPQFDACGDANSAMSSAEETPDTKEASQEAEKAEEKEQTDEVDPKKVVAKSRPKLARRRPRRTGR